MATIAETYEVREQELSLYEHCETTMREYIVQQCRLELYAVIDECYSKDRKEVYATIASMKDADICEAVKCHTLYTDEEFAEWVVSVYAINHRQRWNSYDETTSRQMWEQIAKKVAYNCMNRVYV